MRIWGTLFSIRYHSHFKHLDFFKSMQNERITNWIIIIRKPSCTRNTQTVMLWNIIVISIFIDSIYEIKIDLRCSTNQWQNYETFFNFHEIRNEYSIITYQVIIRIWKSLTTWQSLNNSGRINSTIKRFQTPSVIVLRRWNRIFRGGRFHRLSPHPSFA